MVRQDSLLRGLMCLFSFLAGGFRHPYHVSHGIFCDYVAAGAAAAYSEFTKKDFLFGLTEARSWLEVDFNCVWIATFCRVARNVKDA